MDESNVRKEHTEVARRKCSKNLDVVYACVWGGGAVVVVCAWGVSLKTRYNIRDLRMGEEIGRTVRVRGFCRR